jgi:hypothetical protein
MKLIEQMTLQECLDALHDGDVETELFKGSGEWGLSITKLRAYENRIHELTKWISVDERTPTEKDGPSVLVKSGEVSGWYRVVPYMYANGLNGYSHWKRVEP